MLYSVQGLLGLFFFIVISVPVLCQFCMTADEELLFIRTYELLALYGTSYKRLYVARHVCARYYYYENELFLVGFLGRKHQGGA